MIPTYAQEDDVGFNVLLLKQRMRLQTKGALNQQDIFEFIPTASFLAILPKRQSHRKAGVHLTTLCLLDFQTSSSGG
jgi:hypothetical protein